jgi:hypothetical protein
VRYSTNLAASDVADLNLVDFEDVRCTAKPRLRVTALASVRT